MIFKIFKTLPKGLGYKAFRLFTKNAAGHLLIIYAKKCLIMFTAKLKVVSNTKYNDKITLPTVTDSIDSNDLTEEDMESIYTKIFNNQGLVKIVEAIENYTNKNEEM